MKRNSERILVIDDEPQIQRFLRISLTSQGYDVVSAEDGAQGIAQAGLSEPDLIILDLGLPDMDGQDVLQRLREFTIVPIIVLSVRSSENEKVRALDAGASDYVVKPFGVNELLARIRRLIVVVAEHRYQPMMNFNVGTLQIDPANHRVYLNNEMVHLAKKEFQLLLELAKSPGRIVTQQKLLQGMWGPSHGRDAHYLRILVGKLRTKLNDDASAPKFIETEPGVGYRFLGEETGAEVGEANGKEKTE